MARPKRSTKKANTSTTEQPKFEIVPLDKLMLDPANTRLHPERNRAALKASLTRFGAARSIVVDDNNIVRAGNGTLEAAREAGLKRVLVIETDGSTVVAVRRPDWSPTEAAAYSVGDNHIAELAVDNKTALAEVLEGLRNEDFDLDALGYTSAEVDALLEEMAGEWAGSVTNRGDAIEEDGSEATEKIVIIVPRSRAKEAKEAILEALDAIDGAKVK